MSIHEELLIDEGELSGAPVKITVIYYHLYQF